MPLEARALKFFNTKNYDKPNKQFFPIDSDLLVLAYDVWSDRQL
jgi:hypothetical protein